MAKYAKNYLPIMFNMYTTEPRLDDSMRQSIVDTVRHFLQIADAELINSFLVAALDNYESYARKYDAWLVTSSSKKSAPVGDETMTKPREAQAGKKRVEFDFKKMEKEPMAKTDEIQPFLFAKYAFLDLIGVLAKYANKPATIDTVYQLAHFGITV